MNIRSSWPDGSRCRAGLRLVTRLASLATLVLLLSATISAEADPGAVAPVTGQWPLRPQPQVVQGFDPPTTPWGRGHRGVDLAGRAGQVVRSALPGRVVFAGQLAGRGVLVVDHGDTRTTYEPVAPGVRVGQIVAEGGRLGRLLVTGSHCAPAACLHWGWLRGAEYLDPLRLVGAGPVRLVPLGGLPSLTRPDPVPRAPTMWAQARGWACW